MNFNVIVVSFGCKVFVFLLIQMSGNAQWSNNCLRCDDFNRQSVKECSATYDDCGQCLPGFLQDKTDFRLCYELEILESPAAVISKEIESEVHLLCIFNAEVTCVWERNHQHVAVGGKSRYQFRANGVTEYTETHDCSLTINQLSSYDVGQWQCSNMATDQIHAIKSTTAFISILPKIVVHPEPTINAIFGQSVDLKCEFDRGVNCAWYQKTEFSQDFAPVNINGNYQYADSESAGLKTNCSLRINKLTSADIGQWKCSNQGSNDKEKVSYGVANLKGKQRVVSSPLIYFNGGVVNGRSIDLSFNQNMRVKRSSTDFKEKSFTCSVNMTANHLQWTLNGSVMEQHDDTVSAHLDQSELESYHNGQWSFLILRCVAIYDGDTTTMARVNLTKPLIDTENNETNLWQTATQSNYEAPFQNATTIVILVLIVMCVLGISIVIVISVVCLYKWNHKKTYYETEDLTTITNNSKESKPLTSTYHQLTET